MLISAAVWTAATPTALQHSASAVQDLFLPGRHKKISL